MANAYGSKSLTEIENDLHILGTVPQAGDVYGLDAEQLASLRAQATLLSSAAAALAGAIAAEKAARKTRDETLADARTLMQSTANVVYATSPATDAQLRRSASRPGAAPPRGPTSPRA